MPNWKQITSKPAGSLPSNFGTRAIVIVAGALIIVLLLSVLIGGGGGEDAPDPTAELVEQGTLPPDVEQRLASQILDQQRQQQTFQDNAERDAQRDAIRASNLTLGEPEPGLGDRLIDRLQADTAPLEDPTADPWTSDLFGPEEAELRLTLHLESLEREKRSLRSDPIAFSHRNQQTSIRDIAGAVLDPERDPLGDFTDLFSTLAGQQAAASPLPPPAPQGGTLDVPLPNSDNLPSYDEPEQVVSPDDPPGSNRIYEGTFVEAVLVTQLSGDFPSPVIAQVSVPYYSTDRQTILIPRGSRFIGTAQAVRDRDQARLAVGFHRLLFPDGRWAALDFRGLNQLGEGALKDQVDRHYLSTFLAAGGVGLLSGLARAGTNPYAGDQLLNAQLGAGQSLAESGMQIMDRFLNRLPTITIRAGHRLRVWFTADLLIPAP